VSDFAIGVFVGIGLSAIIALILIAAKGFADAMKLIRGDGP